MNIGLFTREGKNLVGRIGPLALAWDRHEGGRLAISRLVAGEPLPVVRGAWAEGESSDRGPAEAFSGMLALLTAGDEVTLARKKHALQNPLTPIVDGSKALYYCPMEGTTVIGKTAEYLKVTLPADPAERQVRLHIRGLGGRPVGNPAKLVWPLSDGGTADDPNGPNLLRPDDRHGPILTDADRPPDEQLATIPLAADREVDVELTSAPGIWLAAQR